MCTLISYQLSVISYQLSVISYQLAVRQPDNFIRILKRLSNNALYEKT